MPFIINYKKQEVSHYKIFSLPQILWLLFRRSVLMYLVEGTEVEFRVINSSNRLRSSKFVNKFSRTKLHLGTS